MGDNYIPVKDADARTWMQNFASVITANPAMYQLQASDAANITDVVNAFVAAYATATGPSTRTAATVAVKDQARNTAEQLCRQYAILIKYNAGIYDDDKIAAGVRPVNTARQPINVPDSSPLLNVLGSTPGSQTVRYADSSTPTTAAKPFGAASLQLFVAVGDAPVGEWTAANFYGAFTKNPVGVGFDPTDNGKTATYFARWQSRNGDVGPWSLPVSLTIAA
ncbi:hypothetical protein BH10PLA1_BH10PLA1_02190 [soil metagenome]